MPKVISNCPVCGTKLKITSLHCNGCGMELRNDFELNPFDTLSPEESDFLIAFLKQRGNMSAVQSELGLSYPAAKKRLDDLLVALNLAENTPQKNEDEEVIDMSTWHVSENSSKASDIIKRKLMENNGRVIVHTARGLPCEIRAASDGVSFLSDKLPGNTRNPPYRYEVFDIVVDLLISQGGRAKKGNGRNHKLGEPDCDETTVVGAIGYQYWKRKNGDSVYDPVFVLAAVLEWAGIASNERGELVLTNNYREICGLMSTSKC